MTLDHTVINVQSRFGVRIPNELAAHDPASDKLVIMLPGRGYTCNHPVLHYLRTMALRHGCDVLSQQYGFQVAHAGLSAESTPYLLDDATRAVEQAMARGYRRVCIAAKSLGTPLAVQLAAVVQAESMSLILLTPVGGAGQGLTDIPALAVIGTADPAYSPNMMRAPGSVQWRVFDGLNHGLEVRDDWQGSIRALHEVIAACEAFLLGVK